MPVQLLKRVAVQSAHVEAPCTCTHGLLVTGVTMHACMQLLGELLLERSNLKVMVRYVADEGNLKLMMNLLRDSSRSIQFEAFHVFKVRYIRCLHVTECNSLLV